MAAYVTVGGVDYPVIFDTPGETANILQLSEATEPAVLKYYGVLEGDVNPDRYITYANLVKLLLSKSSIRCAGSVSIISGANTINFSSAVASTNYALIIIDYGLGLSPPVKYVDRFTVDAMDAGTIDYILILNQ